MHAHSIAPVFQVSDLETALRYYLEVLGFQEDFRFGDYAGIKRDGAYLHLSSHSVNQRPLGGGSAYLFCDEVDACHAEIERRGARINTGPKTYDYGMRDFTVVDLDGNHLFFGCPAS